MTHASKAFNYLCVSTMVGRNQSISGHNQYIRTESWKEACEELKITACERGMEKIPVTSASHRN
jgi:hypothetical protein